MSKVIFDEKIAQIMGSQGKNKRMFSNAEYQGFIDRLKAISEPGYDLQDDDHYLIKRFKLMRVETQGQIFERLV